MSDSVIGCCTPCPQPTLVNVPGIAGTPGTPGTAGVNGINAFTITTSNFTVPAVNNTVTINVGVSSWAVVGQNVFITGPSNWQVTAVPTASSLTVKFLGYPGDVAPTTVIGAGAQVSPSGLQGTSQTLLPAISSYSTAGSQALTTSSVQLLTANVTLASPGSYLLLSRANLMVNDATFAASQTITIRLRETTNGPANLPNAVTLIGSPVLTTGFQPIAADIPQVVYVAAAGDTIQVFGTIAALPTNNPTGTVQAIECNILAIKLF